MNARIVDLDKAIQLDPLDADAFRHRARAHEKSGESEKAAADRAKAELAEKYEPAYMVFRRTARMLVPPVTDDLLPEPPKEEDKDKGRKKGKPKPPPKRTAKPTTKPKRRT